VLVGWSYSIAATHGADSTHYTVFWLGVLILIVPMFVVAASRRVGTAADVHAVGPRLLELSAQVTARRRAGQGQGPA
jgi:hypothetical protein